MVYTVRWISVIENLLVPETQNSIALVVQAIRATLLGSPPYFVSVLAFIKLGHQSALRQLTRVPPSRDLSRLGDALNHTLCPPFFQFGW